MIWYIILIQSVLSYKLLDYDHIVSRIQHLNSTCEALTVSTGEERYNIATPDKCEGCQHYILTLSLADEDAPQVYFSGELHGDERLGPLVLIELAEFLCDFYNKDEWVNRLVSTRRIVMTPMTNVQGFKNNHRVTFISGRNNKRRESGP
jgi:predicted deacylase